MASDFAFAQQNLCLMLDEQPSTPFEVPRRRSQQQQRPQQQRAVGRRLDSRGGRRGGRAIDGYVDVVYRLRHGVLPLQIDDDRTDSDALRQRAHLEK